VAVESRLGRAHLSLREGKTERLRKQEWSKQ
jgi:hypothetical protein